MKYLLAFSLVLSACSVPMATVPVSHLNCGKDEDCPTHYYCGFRGVDTRAVCIYGEDNE